jgi:aspartate kinase
MLGLPAQRFLAEEIPIITDDNFKNADIIYEISKENIQKNLQEKIYNSKRISVIPGFTGKTKKGETTTLGRGGTDTTACFIGSALLAHKIILWKDVGGVFSADPKITPEVKTLPIISYEEAEKAGKIIHNKAVQYVKLFNTPLEIVSIINPKLKTKVGKNKNRYSKLRNINFFSVQNFLSLKIPEILGSSASKPLQKVIFRNSK